MIKELIYEYNLLVIHSDQWLTSNMINDISNMINK